MARRYSKSRALNLPRDVAEQAIDVAKRLKLPLSKLIAQATAAYARLNGVNEVSDAPGPTKNGTDTRW